MGHSDIELSRKGREQADRLRDYLAGETIDAAYASDLKRTMATAAAICEGRDLDVAPSPELREFHYGVCEGLTFGEIGAQYPDVAEMCRSFSPALAFPEGEHFGGFSERTGGFLGRLRRHGPEETLLIASHSGPLKVLICLLLGIDPVNWLKLGADLASLSIVHTFPRGGLLVRLNDTSHLREDAG